MGDRLRHADLTALARHGEGRALLRLERTPAGLARLDEVMVSITAGEVGPLVTGIVYCSVLSACHDIFDLRRAQEWTAAMTTWCAAHPDMVPFRGACLIRRSELLQLHGAWDDAAEEARRACERIVRGRGSRPTPGPRSINRRSCFGCAATSRAPRRPIARPAAPGAARSRGSRCCGWPRATSAAADAAIRSALHETKAPRARAQVLHAAVEILLAVGDLAAARGAAGELEELARRADAPVLRAASAHAAGAVALAEGEPRLALDRLARRLGLVARGRGALRGGACQDPDRQRPMPPLATRKAPAWSSRLRSRRSSSSARGRMPSACPRCGPAKRAAAERRTDRT